jgi:hypothetical protein
MRAACYSLFVWFYSLIVEPILLQKLGWKTMQCPSSEEGLLEETSWLDKQTLMITHNPT